MNRPDYYTAYSFECYTLIRLVDARFNIGNVIKYVYRAGIKEIEQEACKKDLDKAVRYIEKELSFPEEHECNFNQYCLSQDIVNNAHIPKWKEDALCQLSAYCYTRDRKLLFRLKKVFKDGKQSEKEC